MQPADHGILRERERLSPLFAVSPATRCGSTWLQRVLNSSGEILVYGENRTLLESTTNVVGSVMFNCTGARAAQHVEMRRQISRTEEDSWTPALWPEPSGYLLLTMRQMVELFLYYERDAAEFGRSNWGMKFPLQNASLMAVVSQILPNARFLVLYRHVADALASAKARRFVVDRAGAAAFIRRWNDNLIWLLSWEVGRKCVVRYEDLVSAPDTAFAPVLEFAGVQKVSPAVLMRRVNTFRGEGPGYDPSGYVAPETLSEAEQALVLELAADGLKAGGYI